MHKRPLALGRSSGDLRREFQTGVEGNGVDTDGAKLVGRTYTLQTSAEKSEIQ